MMRVVTKFADAMAERLEDNSHKSGWESMTPLQHLARLKQEVGELERAVRANEPRTRIRDEAADVGNFAAMLVAVYREPEATR